MFVSKRSRRRKWTALRIWIGTELIIKIACLSRHKLFFLRLSRRHVVLFSLMVKFSHCVMSTTTASDGGRVALGLNSRQPCLFSRWIECSQRIVRIFPNSKLWISSSKKTCCVHRTWALKAFSISLVVGNASINKPDFLDKYSRTRNQQTVSLSILGKFSNWFSNKHSSDMTRTIIVSGFSSCSCRLIGSTGNFCGHDSKGFRKNSGPLHQIQLGLIFATHNLLDFVQSARAANSLHWYPVVFLPLGWPRTFSVLLSGIESMPELPQNLSMW